jgi:peptide/nickel transport system permease protein
MAVLGALILIAILAPKIAPYSIATQSGDVYAAPNAQHWLGTDDGGVDMISLLMWGIQVSLIVGFLATLVSTIVGATIGVTAGYFGGAVDMILMRITDYFLVIPDIPLIIIIAAIWGPSLFHIIIVIGLLLWTFTPRVVRAQVKSVRERTYIQRTRSLGAGHLRILFMHVVPQVLPLIIANTVLTVAVAIFDETALSFLGLGDPTRISLGKIIANAFERSAIGIGAWWAVVPPGLLVALIILCCSLIGQSIEDSFNPRLRVAHLSARHFRLLRFTGVGRPTV